MKRLWNRIRGAFATQNDSGCCCVKCRLKGKVTETNMDASYDQFKGIYNSFPVCPKCGGTIRPERINCNDDSKMH
jgi:NAD-dependent SIR2 family protein deacetylase